MGPDIIYLGKHAVIFYCVYQTFYIISALVSKTILEPAVKVLMIRPFFFRTLIRSNDCADKPVQIQINTG
jgi:hypothetical protein